MYSFIDLSHLSFRGCLAVRLLSMLRTKYPLCDTYLDRLTREMDAWIDGLKDREMNLFKPDYFLGENSLWFITGSFVFFLVLYSDHLYCSYKMFFGI